MLISAICELCNKYISEQKRIQIRKIERERAREGGRRRERILYLSVFTCWPIDGSSLTETELDGRVSLALFGACCADKLMGKNIIFILFDTPFKCPLSIVNIHNLNKIFAGMQINICMNHSTDNYHNCKF